MRIDAKILEIREKEILFGLVDQNGQCGTDSCEGCKCGAGLKTIKLSRGLLENPCVGMKVEICQERGHLLHFALLIVLPLLILMLAIKILPLLNPDIPEKWLNISAAGSAVLIFITIALFIKKISPPNLTVIIREE